MNRTTDGKFNGRKRLETSRGPLVLGLHKHKKGNLYTVIGTHLDANNDNPYPGILKVEYIDVLTGDKYGRDWTEFHMMVEWPDGKFRPRFQPCNLDGSLING